jgi:hypothetical protein
MEKDKPVFYTRLFEHLVKDIFLLYSFLANFQAEQVSTTSQEELFPMKITLIRDLKL